MAGLLRYRRGKAALIALVLLTLSLAATVAIQPGGRSPDNGSPMGYAGLRPDWVRVPPLPPAPLPSAIQAAPATPTERPLPAPTPVEPPPTVEAPPPTETITIAGVFAPVEAPPSPSAAPPVESRPPPTESPSPPVESPPPPTQSPAPTPTPTVTEGLDLAVAEALVELTNQARLANGLTPLAEHPSLVAATQKYANLHAHLSPDRLDHHLNGSTLDSRVEAEGYAGWTFLAENLVWGSVDLSPAEAVQAWLASPAHRDNMLNPTVNETGVGCYVSAAAEQSFRICVQDFGTRP